MWDIVVPYTKSGHWLGYKEKRTTELPLSPRSVVDNHQS